ncbi:MAG: 1-(5-phosphoribosyl)-5-((5-phosphoribosylamino)methylideneamino)imidazole-4-carboxamide isomerase [Saccharolobus sp.]
MSKILPSIDISNGKVVKRIKGVSGSGLILGEPEKIAKEIYDEGYDEVHIVDLDAAEGIGNNEEHIKKICKVGFKWIQIGGGIRDYEKASRLIGFGASTLVFSTLVFSNYSLFKEISEKIGYDKVLVSIDYDKDKRVLVKGWKEKSLDLTEAIKKVNENRILGTILTYVENEGTSKGIDYNVKDIVKMLKGKKEYAGGVSSISDVEYLKSIGFDYVIVGMSFYLKKLRGVKIV